MRKVVILYLLALLPRWASASDCPPNPWTGPTSVTLGSTHTYTFDNGSAPAGLMWYITKGLMVSSSQSGTMFTVSVQWIESGAGELHLAYEDDIIPIGFTSRNVTVSGSPPSTPNTTFTLVSTSCNRTVVKRNSNPPSGVTWVWQTSATGTSYFLGSADSVVLTTTGSNTIYLRAQMNGAPIWSGAQNSGSWTVVTPLGASATATDGHGIGNTATAVPLSVITVSGATSYKWYTAASGGTAISGATTTSYTPSVTETKTYYAEAWVQACGGSARKAVVANLHPEPVITSDDGTVNMGTTALLKVENYAYSTYQWINKTTGAAVSGATSSTFTTTSPADFTVRVTKSSSVADTSAAFTVGYGLEGLNMNYVIASTVLTEGITGEEEVDELPVEEKSQTIQYFDGLGAPMQTVITQGSPLKKDIVQQAVYDGFGREHRTYLPVVVNKGSGWYKPNILNARGAYSSIAEDFYQDNPNARIAQDTMPYTQTVFEASPAGRPLKDYGAGSKWAVNNRSIRYDYRVNTHTTGATDTAEKVIAWKVNNNRPERKSAVANYVVTNGYYASGQLSIKIVTDEQGNRVREYTNKQGQVILKKVQAVAADSTNLNSASGWALTYYVYDPMGNLRFVLPPELSKIAHGSDTAVMNTVRLANWAFQYTYDSRKRMATKQVPGAGAVYMVYDKRDRLVATQDANQRATANRYWSFTKYDQLNRPVLTGIKDTAALLTQAQMQAAVDAHYAKAWAKLYETFIGTTAGNVHGYSNKSYPVLTGPATTNDVHRYLSVTYYDTYAFKNTMAGDSSDYTFSGVHVTGQEASYFKRLTGQVTGTKIKVLDGGVAGGYTWLKTVNYYDDDYRLIQTVSDNYKQGRDRNTSIYDFTGKVVKSKSTHGTSAASRNITRTFAYDHGGRLLKMYHAIDNEDAVLLVQNQYNELGQLVTKALHLRNDGNNFAQTVDYRYNIRGWLTSINDPAINSNALFSFNLKYNDPTANGGTAQYNGNISETIWKTAGSQEASYGYEYDPMNRLTESAYYSAGKNNRFNENILNGSSPGYDLNGNIQYLQRTGKTGASTFGSMDNLTYTYSGNQLTRVDDAVADAAGQDGFKELVKTANEYTYDANGNMITDANKGITLIKYNHLNLPRMVKKSGADSIVYIYDAAGVKLKQRVYGAKPKVTDYAGEFIYENDTLRFINHEEGRILPDELPETDYAWEYQYHLKDHLGNARVTFSEKTTTTEYTTSLEETTNNDFENYMNRNSFSLGKRTGSYSQKLTGGSNSQIGLAKSFEVNAGDAFDLEVYAKYEEFDEEGTATNLNALISALTGAFSLNPSGGTGLEGQAAYNAFTAHYGGGSLVDPGDIEDDDPPRAFLNYILFDENFVLADFGFDQVTDNSEQVGASPNVPHDYLSLHIKVKQKGYLYVFLSNENPVLASVYFDDFTITHHTGIEQSDDYYAFGMEFNSYQRENSAKNNYLYNGKEKQDELDLGWLDYGARMYMADIGRWGVVDSKADKYAGFSPYEYALNSPIYFLDPDGNEVIPNIKITRTEVRNKGITYTAEGSITLKVKIINSSNIDVDMVALKSNLAADVNKTYSGKGFYQESSRIDLEGNLLDSDHTISVFSNITVNVEFEVIKSLDELKEDDHVLMLVNDIPKLEGEELDPAGRGALSGNVAAVEAGIKDVSGVANHELGHNFGLPDLYRGVNGKKVELSPGNTMSDAGNRSTHLRQKGKLTFDILWKEALKKHNGQKSKTNTKKKAKEFIDETKLN